MKFEINIDCVDSLFVQFLREEVVGVHSALHSLAAEDELSIYELDDLWYNHRLLGAMYVVEEYFSDNPQLREMYSRDFKDEFDER